MDECCVLLKEGSLAAQIVLVGSVGVPVILVHKTRFRPWARRARKTSPTEKNYFARKVGLCMHGHIYMYI